MLNNAEILNFAIWFVIRFCNAMYEIFIPEQKFVRKTWIDAKFEFLMFTSVEAMLLNNSIWQSKKWTNGGRNQHKRFQYEINGFQSMHACTINMQNYDFLCLVDVNEWIVEKARVI